MMHDTMLALLRAAAELADRFEAEVGRPLTPGDVALAMELRNSLTTTPSATVPVAPPSTPDAPLVGELPLCPVCGGRMWDNRQRKAEGTYKSAAPDLSCRDRECTGRVWTLKPDHMRIPTTTPSVPSSPFGPDDDNDLPF